MTLKSDSEDAAEIEMFLGRVKTGKVQTVQQTMQDRTGPFIVSKIHDPREKSPESTTKNEEAEDAAEIEMFLRVKTGKVQTIQQAMQDRTGPLIVAKMHDSPGKRLESPVKDGKTEWY